MFNILPYAQKVFEQSYRGKAAYSVLEYLNNPDLYDELQKEAGYLEPPRIRRKLAETSGISEVIAAYQNFLDSFADKRHNFCKKKKNNEMLIEEEFIIEEEIIQLVDCAVLATLVGDGEGFTSVGCEMDVLKREGLLEQCRFARQYLSEIRRRLTDERTKYYLDFSITLGE